MYVRKYVCLARKINDFLYQNQSQSSTMLRLISLARRSDARIARLVATTVLSCEEKRRASDLDWQPIPIDRALFCSIRSFSTTNSTEKRNAFSILGVPKQFAIDASQLKTLYRQLMAELHPDKHANKTETERLDFERQASEVTNAYETLVEVHTRATHLLDVLGRPMEDSASGKVVGHEFLMEVMLLREEIDSSSGDEMLKPLLGRNQYRIEETCQELEQAFEESDLDKAVELTARLQYWNRIDETIREKINNVD